MMSFIFLLMIPLNVNAAGVANKVTISIVGDVTLGEFKGQSSGNQVKDYYDAYGPTYFFEKVQGVFATDDITFVNLEGPLTNYTQTAQKTYPIKGDVRNVTALTTGSVEVVNLSNNHIYDCGDNGFIETMQLLQMNNIGFSGEGYRYVTEKNGVTVEFFGYRGWSYSKDLQTQIQNDLSSSTADIKIVEFHWGEERKYVHNKTQEQLAHWTIDCGADLVVGAHPHVLQDTEIYNGKLIAYSLGNFSFGANKNPKDKDTTILSITFDKQGNYNFVFLPCSISSTTERNNYQPMLVTDETVKTRIFNKLKLQ